MNRVKTATEEKMPPTVKFAACWNSPSRMPPMTAPRLLPKPAQRHRDEAVEVEQRSVGEEGQQELPAGEARQRADGAGQRIAGDAQVALGQAEGAGGEVVLGDGDEGAADQRVAIEVFEPDDGDDAGADRQPVFLVPDAGAHLQQPREGLRLRAPLQRGQVLDQQRDGERREHVEVLVEAFQHRPHRDEFGDDAEQRAAGSVSTSATGQGSPSRSMKSEPKTPPSIPSCPAVKLITREVENMVL